MFPSARKQAQQIAQQFLSGHCGLVVWWTLRHAGILEAMVQLEAKGDAGLEPRDYAASTNMSPEVLESLVRYLATTGLVAIKNDGARLTAEGQALLENEDGVLGLIRAYQPVLDMAEHLLAKLKTYSPSAVPAVFAAQASTASATAAGGGVSRKPEYLLESQAQRYRAEVFPTIAREVSRVHVSHLLDLTCGMGDLLIHAAQHARKIVGVGISADGIAARRANQAFQTAALDKRLLAITANPFDVCLDTARTFDRIGVSRQLWKELDGLIAVNLFAEFTEKPADIARVLAAVPASFPKATLLLAEPIASPRFEKNYYAPELALVLNLARSRPLPAEKWHEMIKQARLRLLHETPLTTDGLCVFACKAMAV